jgi:hypothetical protein
VAFGEFENALDRSGITYDTILGHWVTCASRGNSEGAGWNHFFNKNIPGDFYCLMDDIGTASPLMFWFDNDNFGFVTNPEKARYLPGLMRISTPHGTSHEKNFVCYDLWNTNTAKYKMIYGGFTSPINAVLWSGAWQSDGAGATYDSSAACALVTAAACSKLKTDWGDNIRIYIIKYRKQPQYKHKVTEEVLTFGYSYLDGCASKPSYVYDVTDEASLKSTLSTIAADIKSFAGYAEAREHDHQSATLP